MLSFPLLALSLAPHPNTGGRPAVTIPTVQLNLDLPPEERWKAVVAPFKPDFGAVVDYLKSVVPAWTVPIIELIASDLGSYFGDLGLEMAGAAEGLGVSKGLVVTMNLMMQLESLGVNCSNWNETGPTTPNDPGCVDVDPKQTWCYCHDAARRGTLPADGVLRKPPREGPGLCTSVVAQTDDGRILHARNLDWDLPLGMRKLLYDVELVRNGSVVAKGTGGVGFVGMFNGMVAKDAARGAAGYSVTIDARGKGGSLVDNFVQALLHKSKTPSQHLRGVLEQCDGFACAVPALAASPLIDENYYIVAGTAAGEGAVISRGREKAEDVWRLDAANASDPAGWYRLQTNYDHWNPVPKADDRRHPGYAMMDSLGRGGTDLGRLKALLMSPPVFNLHTDYSALIEPATGLYNSTVWLDAPNAAAATAVVEA